MVQVHRCSKKILCKKLKNFGEKIAQWSRVLACRAKGRGFKSRFSLTKPKSALPFLLKITLKRAICKSYCLQFFSQTEYNFLTKK